NPPQYFTEISTIGASLSFGITQKSATDKTIHDHPKERKLKTPCLHPGRVAPSLNPKFSLRFQDFPQVC
ncbi:hypothetical protein HMPREF0580_1766, partial [Mobiluncus mulieris ATCC 35239]